MIFSETGPCLSLLLCTAFLASAAHHPITIDDVLKAHEYVGISPVWSPTGDGFVYEKGGSVYRVKGGAGSSPASWFAVSDLGPGPAGELDSGYSWTNRRVSREDLQWLPDGESLLVLHQGALYIVKEKTAPEHLPLMVRPEDPLLSPDGKSILYRWHHNLYVYDIASKRPHQVTQDGSPTMLNGELDWVYPEELDLGQAVWWSPDSKSVAFMQFDISHEFTYPHADLLPTRAIAEPQRYPQAGTPNAKVRVGVISVASGDLHWLKVGNSADTLVARVAWLSDSTRVAVETAPRIQNELDLWFCDPVSGDAHRILQESSKTWVNIEDNFVPIPGRREFLWTSERTGFRHIYRYSYDGKELQQLTNGDWEVRGIAGVSTALGRVFYLSSEDTPLETQLFEIGIEGGKRIRVSEAGFDHMINLAPDCREYIDISSNLKTPPAVAVRSTGDERSVTLAEAKNHVPSEFTTPEIVNIKAADGTLLYGLLQKPVNYVPGQRYPVIVKVYGGPGVQSLHNSWRGLDMDDVYRENGFVVWELDNRGSTGRGHRFEEPIFHALGSVEIADQVSGVNYLVRQGIADPKRVGVTGWSYGGYMTIRCLLLAGETFKAGVAGAPVTDWHNYDTIYTERYMGLPSQNIPGYEQSSNVAAAASLQGKLLIQHNLEDDNVLFQNTMQFVNALEQANKQYYLQLYPEKTHGVSGDLRAAVMQAQFDFLTRNLQ